MALEDIDFDKLLKQLRASKRRIGLYILSSAFHDITVLHQDLSYDDVMVVLKTIVELDPNLIKH